MCPRIRSGHEAPTPRRRGQHGLRWPLTERRSRGLVRRHRPDRRAGKTEAATASPFAHEIGDWRSARARGPEGHPGDRRARRIAGGHYFALSSSLWRRRGPDLGCIGVHQRIGGHHPHAPILGKQGGTPGRSQSLRSAALRGRATWNCQTRVKGRRAKQSRQVLQAFLMGSPNGVESPHRSAMSHQPRDGSPGSQP